jgi:ribosomal protein S18 acetylase RimI-like enzyme
VNAAGGARVTIVDVTDETTFALLPPCADPGFDHRSCDYWEDADRGSKAIRLDWLEPGGAVAPEPAPRAVPANPFLADLEERRANPFAIGSGGGAGPGIVNPLLPDDDALADNPFAPRREPRPTVADTAPRKLRLLARGLGVAGSYAKVLLADDVPAAYCQFGPLTAYPRAQRTRDLYPALPDAPLPAVITCIASTAEARGQGLAKALVAAVCDDLEGRGFAAVETYPAIGARPDATSAATPAFWESVGFVTAAPDERFPVMRRELG